jgi:hypothetical protein
MNKKLIVIGGGAAGFFCAINAARQNPNLDISILEQSKDVLSKVKVSGGGRCNATHACWEPKELVKNYPRGHKELLGPFHQFACGDTFAWFEERGVNLKIEDDGRCFPDTDSSQTIIDCFINEATKYKIKILTHHKVKSITPPQGDEDKWHIGVNETTMHCDLLMLASGSSNFMWNILKDLGHSIIPPVPSLFTFNIKDPFLHQLAGISMPAATVNINATKYSNQGPLLITHWGMSGPAVLKLSAEGAIWMHEQNYKFDISIDWISNVYEDDIRDLKMNEAKKSVLSNNFFEIPSRLWKYLMSKCNIDEKTRWGDLNKSQLESIVNALKNDNYQVNGKSTFKEEFVTAGGVDLKEINFKTFASKVHPTLYMAGEVLNIDAVTGGFNFQAAWTGGFLAAGDM